MQCPASGWGEALFTEDTQLFASADPLQVTRDVARIFKPHRLKVRGGGSGLYARMNTIRQGNFSVSRLGYGAEVDIDPGRLDDFYLLQIPLTGSADIACGGVRFDSSPLAASLVSPTLPLRMRWLPGNTQICVRFERDFVETHCAAHLGHPLDAPLEFGPSVPLQTAAARYFLRLLVLFMEEMALAGSLDADGHPLIRERVADQFAASLLNALLYSQPHSWSEGLKRPAQSVAPHFVRRAEDYIRHHFRDAVTIEMLAKVAGVSTRTLFSGFRDFRNTTPMVYLKDLRLDKARQSLLAGEAADSAQVTHIALDCGFSHLGRFAASYRARFGEPPSTTARFKGGR